MSIYLANIKKLHFSWAHSQAVASERYYSWEVRVFGSASAHTKELRHYWLQMLLEEQLREFDRG